MAALADVAEALRRAEVTAGVSTGTRALVTSDASLYRVAPAAAVRVRHEVDLLAVRATGQALGVPVTLRGAGTSITGNTVGAGNVVDTRSYARLLDIDPDTRTAWVQHGCSAPRRRNGSVRARPLDPHAVHDRRNDQQQHPQVADTGLWPHARQRVLFGNGEAATLGPGSPDLPPGTAIAHLAALADPHLRTAFGRFDRQVSGYGLEHVLPASGLVVGPDPVEWVVLARSGPCCPAIGRARG